MADPPILRLKQHRSALQALQAMPLALLDIQQYSTRHHIIATQPRVLLGLGRSSSSIFLSITILYLLTGKHRIFYSPTSILGGTFSIVQRRACLLPFPLSQSGRADGGVYYNRHLDKGSIFPWVKKGPDTIFFRSFPTSSILLTPKHL